MQTTSSSRRRWTVAVVVLIAVVVGVAVQALSAGDGSPGRRGHHPDHRRGQRGGDGAVGWTVDTLGWKGTSGGITAQQVADRAVGALQPGEIVLMPSGRTRTRCSGDDGRRAGRRLW